MNYFKIIKSDLEHELAMEYLMQLMDADPAEGSQLADELDVLALLIERYEQEQFPVDLPDPIEAIKFRMDQQGLRKKDLIPYIGSAPKVSEVLNGNRTLSLNMIRKLSAGLGISADVLIRTPEQKFANENEIEWSRFPLSHMRKAGYFSNFNGDLRELKEYGKEHITGFLSSVKSGFSLQPTMLRTSAQLRKNDKETDEYALWAWQVKVLQQANSEVLATAYESGTVDTEWLKKLAQLSWSEKGPLLAKEYLNNHGIHLVFEPHLPKTYLDGAVCLHAGGNPVVALTLRHDRLDNFWFTLMHELAHIALHIDGGDAWFIDDLDAESIDKCEREADALAQQALLPVAQKTLDYITDADSVRHLAQQLNIHACVIAGRLRFDRNKHTLFGQLFRDKIRELIKCS